jgi:UTP--glucose-1-phosphate uridylyltransferase
VESYFKRSLDLENELTRTGKPDLAAIARKPGELCKITPVIQEKPLGLGHAVLMAEAAIGDEPFAVLLPDDMIDGPIPCTRQLIDVFESRAMSVVGVMEVPELEVKKYGIVGGKTLDARTTRVERVVEKPDAKDAPSRLAIPGRYVLSPKVFAHLKNVKAGRGGEIQLTDGLEMLAASEGLLAYQFEGDRYDTGDRMGYIDATLTFALRRPELKEGVTRLLKKHLGMTK